MFHFNIITNLVKRYALVAAIAALAGCGAAQDNTTTTATTTTAANAASSINGESIIRGDASNWLSNGRTYDEQRHSPLDQINLDNVDDLSLAWYWNTGTKRGLESTPIVVDGIMFTSGAWSMVWAHDAKTGELLWEFDPQVDRAWARYACCDVVNRGVAAWKGKIYIGTIDGRLIALDAGTGEPVWDINTLLPDRPYTITGAPRIVKDKVVIGNGGAEYGVRGYVTAYNTETGAEEWRFYTVPGNPADGFESDAMREAAKHGLAASGGKLVAAAPRGIPWLTIRS